MQNCKKCGRRLNEGENDLCPACKSTKSHKIKKLGEICIGVAAIVVAFLTGGKGGGKA